MKTALSLPIGYAAAFLCGVALVTSPAPVRSAWSAQNPDPKQSKAIAAYTDREAYQVFALTLLPANQMFVVAETTLGPGIAPEADECIQKTPEFGSQFQSALANFKELNSSPMRLAGKWPPEKQVEVISDVGLAKFVKAKKFNWDAFYKRYPQSIGVVRFSVVGFSEDKTKAIFYKGVGGDGGYMGDGGIYVFQKVSEKWQEIFPSGANYCFEIH